MSIFDSTAMSTARHWTCEQINQFIIDYLEGGMDEVTNVQFRNHLEECPNCEIFLEQYRSTVAVVGDESNVEIPPALIDRTVDFLRKHYDPMTNDDDG